MCFASWWCHSACCFAHHRDASLACAGRLLAAGRSLPHLYPPPSAVSGSRKAGMLVHGSNQRPVFVTQHAPLTAKFAGPLTGMSKRVNRFISSLDALSSLSCSSRDACDSTSCFFNDSCAGYKWSADIMSAPGCATSSCSPAVYAVSTRSYCRQSHLLSLCALDCLAMQLRVGFNLGAQY